MTKEEIRRGRPRKFANAAEKQKAFRQKQAGVIDSLNQRIADLEAQLAEERSRPPQIKIVEKVVETVVQKPSKKTKAKPTKKNYYVTHDQRIEFVLSTPKFSYPDRLKALQVNVRKAAGAINDVLEMGQYAVTTSVAPELDELSNVPHILYAWGDALESSVGRAKDKKALDVRRYELQRKEKIATIETEIFGLAPERDRVEQLTNAIYELAQYGGAAQTWLAKRMGVEHAALFVAAGNPDPAAVIKAGDVGKQIKFVATVKYETPNRGSYYDFRGESQWSAGWDDVEAYIAYRQKAPQ